MSPLILVDTIFHEQDFFEICDGPSLLETREAAKLILRSMHGKLQLQHTCGILSRLDSYQNIHFSGQNLRTV